jgi:hypothetical protein
VVTTGAGTCTLTISQAGDDRWAAASDVVHELEVARASQTIGLRAPASRTLGDPPIPLSASATSGLPVEIATDGPCQLGTAGELVLSGAGICRVTASQSGDADWAPAPPLVHELSIERAPQAIVFEAPAGVTFGHPAIVLEATSTSGLPVAFSADGPCRVVADRLIFIGAGSCSLTARQEGDERWASATPSVREIRVARAPQSITFPAPEAMSVGDAPRVLDAASTSGLAVAFSADGSCEIVDGALQPTGPGLCAITAAQHGNGDYEAADDVRHVIRIARMPQRIDFVAPRGATLGDPPIGLSATATSGLPVTFAARGACAIEGLDRLVVDGVGRCRVVAVQAGDETWAPADVTRTFEVTAPVEPTAVGAGGTNVRPEAAPASTPEATPP